MAAVVTVVGIRKDAKGSMPTRFRNAAMFITKASNLFALSSNLIARNRSVLKDLCKSSDERMIVDVPQLIFGQRGGTQQDFELFDLVWSG